jgi:hypothetical protein
LASGASDGGDRVDLDELVLVAEDRDAEKRARRIMLAEGVSDGLPRRSEIGLIGGSYVDGALDHVAEVGPGVV